MRNVTNGTLSGGTIDLINGQAPEPLIRMMDPDSFYGAPAQPTRTPISLLALLLTISLTAYMVLRKRG